MIKGCIIHWTGAIALIASAQAPVYAQVAARPVAGTQVWLVPPTGFGPAAGFTGFRRGEAALQVIELKGGNYYRQVAGFSKERFAAKGGNVLQYQEIQGQPYPARLVRVQLSPALESAQLLFGDSTFAVLLDARYPAADTALSTAMRRSLLSATYHKPEASAPSLANAPFQLDEKKSPFALAETSRGRFIYSLGGQRKPTYGTEPIVTVGSFPINQSVTAADISQQALSQQPGLVGFMPRKQTSGKVNDLVTYETEGFAQLNGKRVLVYQQVTVIGSTAITLLGIAQQEPETALAQFKSLTHTITARKH
ncbi:hypothetical protein ACFPAF_14500 [Hymenobacter endophyticus]|uniref:Uncharacterized protein n=1 Tax=Hymenobacter endophyticus TaxID=3076335 RepID=A0ABU3TJR1_9BACT|nr:hypothetical protein [Hymenobacter endophyticus]MDU0371612.1 hypothetical protein [Hymenobacter endophyticus]